ncbi:tyrosine-type recombinase/integrase [Methylobacterium sp. WL64]|nr:tyrosine-type recombinase/integrase [Methylobacterium sp. WL64]
MGVKGQIVALPIGPAWASIKVGSVVQASLRTKEPKEARIRHSAADGALKELWQAERSGALSSTDPGGVFEHKDWRRHLVPVGNVIPLEPLPAPSPAKANEPHFTAGDLFERWALDRADKRAPNTIKRYRGSYRSFDAFANGRDARDLTSDDVFAWAERRRDVEGISPRAINKNDLVAVSSVFRWASSRASGKLLEMNPAAGLSLDEPRIVAQRERTFRESEIAAILSAASGVEPRGKNPTREFARRWCPWLAAYTGARIGELTSLEQRDIRIEAGIPIMHLRVTKTGEPRVVPLHAHLIEQGFFDFVGTLPGGPLFYDPRKHRVGSAVTPAELQSRSVAEWVRVTVKLDPGVDPNHGWRHTWKTRALAVGIEERLRDAITGHRVASVGRRYETPTLTMLAEAIRRFPRYQAEMTHENILDTYGKAIHS